MSERRAKRRGVNALFYMRLAAQNMKKNSAVMIPYLLTCAGAVMMYYIISSLVANPGFANVYGGGSMVAILIFGSSITAVFAFIFLIYTNSFLVKQRKQEFGLFQVLGMGKRHLAKIMFFETLYTALISLIGGLLMGFLLCRLFALMLYRLMELDIDWDFSFVPGAAWSCMKLFGVIFLVILFYNIWQVMKARPAEMLSGKHAGEREPKGTWLFSGLGVIFLVAGYGTSLITTRTQQLISNFFLAVLLVIAATCLLFMAGSVTLLKALKRNKAYYYQTRHFISISGMIYRMRQNAAGLSVICLLSTAVLVMVSSSISLYVGIDDVMHTRFMRDFAIITHDYSPDTVESVNRITGEVLAEEQVTWERSIGYRYISLPAVREKNGFEVKKENLSNFNSLEYLFFMTLEDYNRLTGENVELGENQVLLLTDRMEYEDETFSIFDRQYQVVKSGRQEPLDGMDTMGSMGSIHVVLPDEEQMYEVEARQAEAYGDSKYSPTYYLTFDIDAGNEKAVALYEKLENRLNGVGHPYRVESMAESRESFFSLYGGLFFIGIFLGTMFVMATVLIIYYKQISEGYEDKKRFEIMQNVGLSRQEIRGAVRSSVLTMFFLPLVTAAVHICFAFPMIARLLRVMNFRNVRLFACSTAAVVLVFAVFYVVIYGVTSKKYYDIVKR